MDELAARLESLLRHYALACEQGGADANQLWEHFRQQLKLLIAEFGPQAVDAALDTVPDGAGSATPLH